MVSRTAPPLVADAWKYIFHYLDFQAQASCSRVCKLWNETLHELQYEYGRCQALKALNQVPSLNLPFIDINDYRFHVLGVKGPNILLTTLVDQPYKRLNFFDIQTKKLQEVCVNPGRSNLQLLSAQWISKDKFVTLSENSAAKPFYEAVLWEISHKDDVYQFASISQISFQKRGKLLGSRMLPLEKRIFVYEEPQVGYYDDSFDSLESWLQPNLFMIVMRDLSIEVQQVKALPNNIKCPSVSNSKMVFAITSKIPYCLKAYHLTQEGEAKLAWKVNKNNYNLSIEANDRWVVVRESPGSAQLKQTTLHIFDARTGQKIFAFVKDCDLNRHTILDFMAFWLKGDFLAYLAGKELGVIHIPTRSHLSSFKLSEVISAEIFRFKILDIHIDQYSLNIVYEDAAGIQVHQVKLESQYGKPSPLLPTK
jgi:hypothetical protein